MIQRTLAETYGVMVYQEDVARVAIDLAGFPIEDADRLRKVLSKKDRELALADFREEFFRGGRARGVEEETLGKVWDMILSFDGYSFCKAHSASYAQVSYRLAYMKRYYPLEFLASVINNGGGFYGRQTYVDECRRMGFPVLPPDVNASRWEYTAEAEEGAAPGLRVGLGQLRDAAKAFVEALIEERESGGPYRGFSDLLLRTKPRFSDLRILIRSGALDSISEGCTRPQLFFRYQNIDCEDGFGFIPPAPPVVGDYPPSVKLRDELETLGLVVSRHPLELFRARIGSLVRRHGLTPFIRSPDIPRHRGERVWIAGILVTGKEVSTKKKEPMIFVSFEDETAVFETVLFPDCFRRHYPLLDDGWVFLIHGRVEDDMGALAITVERLERVSRQGATAARAVERPPLFTWAWRDALRRRSESEAACEQNVK
jgi:error-prone DNA polymerase